MGIYLAITLSSFFLMKIVGTIKKHSGFCYIRCNEGQYPINLDTLSAQMVQTAVNLTASATVDFNRPCTLEGFDFWLKDDLEIVHALLPYQKY
jgi:hypothetical protein